MRRFVLVLGAVVLGGAVFWLWRTLQSDDAPAAVSQGSSSSASVTSSGDRPAPALPGDPPVPPPERVAVPAAPVDAPPDPEVVRHGLDELHSVVRDAVAPCFENLTVEPKLRRIAFRFRLVVKGQKARIVEPAIYEADFALGERQQCFTSKLEQLEWALDLPDMETPIQDELSGSEL